MKITMTVKIDDRQPAETETRVWRNHIPLEDKDVSIPVEVFKDAIDKAVARLGVRRVAAPEGK